MAAIHSHLHHARTCFASHFGFGNILLGFFHAFLHGLCLLHQAIHIKIHGFLTHLLWEQWYPHVAWHQILLVRLLPQGLAEALPWRGPAAAVYVRHESYQDLNQWRHLAQFQAAQGYAINRAPLVVPQPTVFHAPLKYHGRRGELAPTDYLGGVSTGNYWPDLPPHLKWVVA